MNLRQHMRLRSSVSWFASLLSLLALLFAPPNALSQGAKQRQAKEPLAIQINSDRMEVDNTTNTIIFLGNVIVTRDDLKMTSDRLEVFNDQRTNRLQRIVATKNVTIVQGKRKATGDQAFYVEGEEKIVLKGNARATESTNVITAAEMTLYLRTNRTVITGAPGKRVHVTFYPKSTAGKSKTSAPK